MVKFLASIIFAVVATLSYDTEIRASLSSFLGIVKTIVDGISHSLCTEGGQCNQNDTLLIPSINDTDTNPNDEFPILNPDHKKDVPHSSLPDSPSLPKMPDNNNFLPSTHISPPKSTLVPTTIPDNKKIPWSDFMKQYRN